MHSQTRRTRKQPQQTVGVDHKSVSEVRDLTDIACGTAKECWKALVWTNCVQDSSNQLGGPSL